jgi:large subunit ribosomal protein L22
MASDPVRSKTRNVGIPPQKVRLILDMVRGRGAVEALNLLKFMPNAAAKPVAKTIRSAIANAEENSGLSREDLFVSEIFADEGPSLRRGRAGARGRYKPIRKRSSHITVVLLERETE